MSIESFQPGQVFAGYTVRRLIGAGGFGAVYLARHPRLPKDVALKLLNPQLVGDPAVLRRFEQEAETVARLQHPNIVAVHDRGVEDGALWIAMDYIAGVDAGQLLPGEVSAGRAAHIIAETAVALDFAHTQGVVHRDVKPANILVASAGANQRERVLLADFGIAHVLEATRMTTSGSVLATFAFASPEQCNGDPLDGRSDQYSLACTLFRLLSGSLPYPKESAKAMVAAHLAHPVPRISVLRPELLALDSVFDRAMAKEPADRFPTCGSFASAVHDTLEGRVSQHAGAAARTGATMPNYLEQQRNAATQYRTPPASYPRSPDRNGTPGWLIAVAVVAVSVAVATTGIAVMTARSDDAGVTVAGSSSIGAPTPTPQPASSRTTLSAVTTVPPAEPAPSIFSSDSMTVNSAKVRDRGSWDFHTGRDEINVTDQIVSPGAAAGFAFVGTTQPTYQQCRGRSDYGGPLSLDTQVPSGSYLCIKIELNRVGFFRIDYKRDKDKKLDDGRATISGVIWEPTE